MNANFIIGRTSHYTAFTLLALIQVALFLFLAQHHILSSLDSGDFNRVIAFHVPPSQPLDHPTILVIYANSPFAGSDLNFTLILREVKFREKDLRWPFFRSGFVSMKAKCEYAIAEIESVAKDPSDCGNR
jgi:hypothetical protein